MFIQSISINECIYFIVLLTDIIKNRFPVEDAHVASLDKIDTYIRVKNELVMIFGYNNMKYLPI